MLNVDLLFRLRTENYSAGVDDMANVSPTNANQVIHWSVRRLEVVDLTGNGLDTTLTAFVSNNVRERDC